MTDVTLSTIEVAIDAFKDGKMVIIVDDENRENEGDLVIAAEHVDAEAINFMVTHGRGLVCVAMQAAMLDRLEIPMMVPQHQNSSGFGTGFTISVEAANGVSTGISAADRAHTIKTLINPLSTSADIAMPGHMFPLRAKDGGVLERRGQTEASVDLAKLSELTPAAVICEVMEADGDMMRLAALCDFGRRYQIPVISVEALAQYRRSIADQGVTSNTSTSSTPTNKSQQSTAKAQRGSHETETTASNEPAFNPNTTPLVTSVGNSKLPTAHGEFSIIIFRDKQGKEHSALIKGDINTASTPPIVRMHSECLTGDAFGSLRCDCGEQLQKSMQIMAEHGTGILLYLRQEGRGIGLGNKIRAYELQDNGMDTVDANQHLGFPADAREYSIAAAMLQALHTQQIRLLTNNPDKVKALESHGITITEQMPLQIAAHEHNQQYLATKAQRMGHGLSSVQNNQK